MENQLRRCKQCGEIKPIAQFRKYYNSPKQSRYKVCLVCEKVNNRYKYLNRKVAMGQGTGNDAEQLRTILAIYDAQRALGLKPPGSVDDDLDLDAILQQTTTRASQQSVAETPERSVPAELESWLHADLSGMAPEHLQDVVVDHLLRTYRPATGVDADLKPVYDDTYRDILDQIFKRFDDYEDEVYGEED